MISDQQKEGLNYVFPRSEISHNTRSNHKESWVEGHWLIQRLNNVLGQGNWDWNVTQFTEGPAKMGSHKATKATVHGTLRIFINDQQDDYPAMRSYDGLGSIIMMGEDAVKGATSIAFRQACKYLGVALHLWTDPE